MIATGLAAKYVRQEKRVGIPVYLKVTPAIKDQAVHVMVINFTIPDEFTSTAQ